VKAEIAIAKRIEAGRELMIGALCESPLTFEALTVWRDELNEGKVLLRDIIDLEAMYGAGPDGSPAPVPPPVGPDGKPLNVPGIVPPAPEFKAPEFKKPEPPKPEAKPPGEEGGEAAAATDSAADGDDFDDEGNLPLSAMEAALSRRCWSRWTISPASTRSWASCRMLRWKRPWVRTNCPRARNAASRSCAARPWIWSNRSSSTTNRIEALVDQMYGINRRLVSLEGKLLRTAESHGVDRVEFLKQYFGNELDPNWARRVGRLSGLGWHDFVTEDRDKVKALREEIQALAQETRQSVSEFRRNVQTVQKGERESGVAKKEMIEANLRLVISIAKKYTNRGCNSWT